MMTKLMYAKLLFEPWLCWPIPLHQAQAAKGLSLYFD